MTKDQFSRWDAFYSLYERSLTAEEAFSKYKRRRKVKRKRKTPLQKLREDYAKRVEAKRVAHLKWKADMLATESLLRASKVIT